MFAGMALQFNRMTEPDKLCALEKIWDNLLDAL